MTTPRGIELTPTVAESLTFQSYAEEPKIKGVWVREVRKHRAEHGWFAELLRLDANGWVEGTAAPMHLKQCSASHAEPGRLNAFHIHPREPQNELWTVVDGLLTVWLVDCRKASPTEGIKQRVILSGESPAQLYIPFGVAHGYRAGPRGALLVYAMDQQFDAADANEGRLPWDYFGSELWAEDRG